MRLTINGDEVSYSLEHEKTLAEVLGGVQSWLGSAGFVISAVRADERDLFSIPAGTWSSMPVDSVRELAISALHTGDVKIEHWQTFHAWLGMLADEIKAPGPVMEELLSGMAETIDGAKSNPFLPSGSDGLSRLSSLFTGQSSADVRRWPPEKKEGAFQLLDFLRQELARRIEESSRPRDALARCVAELRALSGKLPNVSVLLQTGQDRAAMETVVGFTDTVQNLLSLVPFLPPDAERGRVIADLTPVLRDLLSAFDSRDFVLVGDLLEYEVTPRIEKLMPLLEKESAAAAGEAGE